MSYMVSTCGSTATHNEKCISQFKDDYGNFGIKELDRPKVAHFLYKYIPLIDERNKQRQNILNLKRKKCDECRGALVNAIASGS